MTIDELKKMKTLKLLSTIFVSILILSYSQVALSGSSYCPYENKRDNRDTRYTWRGDRCEGMLGYNLTGAPTLIAFSTGIIGDFDQNLSVKIHSLSSISQPDFHIQSFLPNERYLFDRVATLQNRFTLDTSVVLRNSNIDPARLWALAKNSNNVYLPVLLGSKSNNYKFVFRSNDEVSFIKVEIRKFEDNTLVKKYSSRRTQPPGREVIFRWDGVDMSASQNSSASQGIYKFVYKGYVESSNSPPQLYKGEILFEHSSLWITQN